MYINTALALSSLLLCAVYLKYAYSSITLNTKNLHKQDPKRFTLHIFDLERCPHPCLPC